MYLMYFDEVKYHPPVQMNYRLGGIIVDAQLVLELEQSVNELSKQCFGSARLSSTTEFHAKDIFQGKANFKGREIAERLETLYWSEDGLPIGVMFTANFGDDAMLFRLAGQLERARPWWGRVPKVFG